MSGFVVRGKDADGIDVYADEDGDDVYCNPNEGTMVRNGEHCPALDIAAGMRAELVRLGCTDVRIFRVADDGTETPLPTYEEALAEIERPRTVADRLDAHRATLRRAEEAAKGDLAAFEMGAALEAVEDAVRALRAGGVA